MAKGPWKVMSCPTCGVSLVFRSWGEIECPDCGCRIQTPTVVVVPEP